MVKCTMKAFLIHFTVSFHASPALFDHLNGNKNGIVSESQL